MKFLTLLVLIIPTFVFAEEKVSHSDLSKKIDLILEKIGGLENRVGQLESDHAKLKKELEQTKKTTENFAIPEDEEGKNSFLKKLRIDLKSEEAKSKGPWTKAETWKSMKRNLTEHKVRKLLGNPDDISISQNPRIDRIYTYTGDIDADGLDDEAEINFLRDRVVSYTSPF
jgi:vacuolar-type H+-ATPase subunit I/STV1